MFYSHVLRIPLFCLVLAVGIFTSVHDVRAQDGGMMITPQRLVFDDHKRGDTFILANKSSETKRYRISIINRAMEEDGHIIDATKPAPGEFFADEYLRVAPRSVTIEPHQAQTVRVMSRLPGDAKDGEYRSHILFEEVAIPKTQSTENDSKQLGVTVQTKVGFALPVILRKGNPDAHITMENPRLLKDESGNFAVVDLIRDGKRSTLGDVMVYKGDTLVGSIMSVGVYMTHPRRIAKAKLTADDLKADDKLTIKYIPTDGSSLPTNETTLIYK